MRFALMLAENDGISIFGASILGASNLGMSNDGALGASGILKSIFGASGSFGASGILKDGASGACAHIDQSVRRAATIRFMRTGIRVEFRHRERRHGGGVELGSLRAKQ